MPLFRQQSPRSVSFKVDITETKDDRASLTQGLVLCIYRHRVLLLLANQSVTNSIIGNFEFQSTYSEIRRGRLVLKSVLGISRSPLPANVLSWEREPLSQIDDKE